MTDRDLDQPDDGSPIPSSFRQSSKRGRRTFYSWDKEIIPAILAQVSAGSSVATACKRLKVSPIIVWRRLLLPQWVDLYTRATEDRAGRLAEKILETVERTDITPDDKRVRVDAMKWFAARTDPKRWAERREMNENPNGINDALAAVGMEALRGALAQIATAAGLQVQSPALPAIEGEARVIEQDQDKPKS